MSLFDTELDDDTTFDDMFSADPPKEIPKADGDLEEFHEQPKRTFTDDEYEEQKAENARIKQQLQDLQQRLQAPANQTPGKQKSLREEIEETMQNTGSIAAAIEHATNKAFMAGQESFKQQHIPLAAQSARQQIARFLDETPMTGSVRKEFDKILGLATDEALASLDNKKLHEAIEGAADMAAGRVARRTQNTRGEEPPVYSTGTKGTSGGRSTGSRRKLTKDEVAAIEMGKAAGLTKEDLADIYGGNE